MNRLVLSLAELPADLRLRPLAARDRERVVAVVDAWWGRPLGALLPRPFFSEFRDTSFVIEREGELVAFLVGFLSQTWPDDGYIHAVGVAPAFRRRGLGRLLYGRFAAVAARAGRCRVRAVTAPTNTNSLAFHRRLGFYFDVAAVARGHESVELVLDLPRRSADADGGAGGAAA